MRALTRFAQVATLTAIGMAVTGLAGQAGQPRSAVPQKPDDRAIVHVLNRIGFGPAPGDLERVRTIGLSAYIDQQLQPERLDDSRMAARLAAFETLSKSTQEMAQQYYLPAQMARREAQRQQSAQTPAGSDPSMTTTTPPNDAARREMMTPEQAEAVRVERQALTELMQAKLLRAALQRPSAPRSHGRLLVQPLQRLLGQRSGPRLPQRVRAGCDPAARVRHVPRAAAGDRRKPCDAVLSRQLAKLGARRSAHGGAAPREQPDEPTQPESDAGVRDPNPGSTESPARAG